MNDKNLLLQDDAFAPPAADSMEFLPSHYAEQPDRRVLQAKGKHPAPCARFCESNAYEIELRRLKARNALLESEAEQLRMSVHNARIELAETKKDANRYRFLSGYPRKEQIGNLFMSFAVKRRPPNDWVVDTVRGESMGAAIDAAMTKDAA